MIDWDGWRENYDRLTWQEQAEFYSRVYRVYPNQNHFTWTAVATFFEWVPEWSTVIEIGGWRGDLAAKVIEQFPEKVSDWLNLEICREAVASPVAPSPYRARWPQNFPWRLGPFEGFDVAVFSHVVEHMKLTEFVELLTKLPDVHHMYVESPLRDTGTNWHGYSGTHIIDAGWGEITSAARDVGFLTSPSFYPAVRYFYREKKGDQ